MQTGETPDARRLRARVVVAMPTTAISTSPLSEGHDTTFTDDEAVRAAVSRIVDVDGWHNIVGMATGVGLLPSALGLRGAYLCARARPALHRGGDLGLHLEH